MKQYGTLKAYVTDNNEIIIEIQNKQKDHGNIIIKYVDENGQEIADQELYEEEVGTTYSYSKTGKEYFSADNFWKRLWSLV